jgi:hypothetical protein
MDVKTTFRNLVRDHSVSICMLQPHVQREKNGIYDSFHSLISVRSGDVLPVSPVIGRQMWSLHQSAVACGKPILPAQQHGLLRARPGSTAEF